MFDLVLLSTMLVYIIFFAYSLFSCFEDFVPLTFLEECSKCLEWGKKIQLKDLPNVKTDRLIAESWAGCYVNTLSYMKLKAINTTI